MRVVHIVPNIGREAAGPTYSVPRICESLLREGVEVTLTTLVDRGAPNYNFIKAFRQDLLFLKRLGFSSEFLEWLRSQAKKNEFKIYHSHSLWMMPNVYPGWAVKGSQVKLIISPRGTLSAYALKINRWVKKLFWIFLQGRVVRQASCLHATAESEYRDIRALGLKQPVCIIPNGIDVPEFEPKQSNLNQRTLLYLGRIHPKKGLINLLHAWAQIENHFPNWKLKIIGPNEGNHLADLLNLRDELALKKIEIIGPLYGKDKLTAYREADLFVLPTHSENFGMTVAESLAAGTPVIVTKGAPWSQIANKNAGWWIDIGIEPLTRCLHQALSLGGEDLANMGVNGRRWMLESYSWDAIASEMASVYQWMIEGGTLPKSVVLT
jgi:glycosyltransferase involved in cell wall biosynthesis